MITKNDRLIDRLRYKSIGSDGYTDYACFEPIEWIEEKGFRSYQAAWDACKTPEWMLWLLDTMRIHTKAGGKLTQFHNLFLKEWDLTEEEIYETVRMRDGGQNYKHYGWGSGGVDLDELEDERDAGDLCKLIRRVIPKCPLKEPV